jgi:hypothetical protein
MKNYKTTAFFYMLGILSGLWAYYLIEQINQIQSIPIQYELKKIYQYETGTRYSLSKIIPGTERDTVLTFGSAHSEGVLPKGLYTIKIK